MNPVEEFVHKISWAKAGPLLVPKLSQDSDSKSWDNLWNMILNDVKFWSLFIGPVSATMNVLPYIANRRVLIEFVTLEDSNVFEIAV